MNHNCLSSRARVRCVFIAGVAALVGTLSVSDTAGASSEPPRFTIESAVDCAGPSITFSYDDHVDGHVPQAVHETLEDIAQIVWTADEVHQVNGDYFNQRTFPMAGVTIEADESYIYQVQITYDDGVIQSDPVLVDMYTLCSGTPAPTSPTSTGSPTPAPDRFALETSWFLCGYAGSNSAYVSWHYTDYPDGHYAAHAAIEVLKNGESVEQEVFANPDWASDGADTKFVLPSDPSPTSPLVRFANMERIEVASYSLSVTVTYEDGATDNHVETFDLNDLCDGRVNGRPANVPQNPGSTATTVTGGSLPATGASDTTWIIGTIGGLLLTTGAALFAGARRSRSR